MDLLASLQADVAVFHSLATGSLDRGHDLPVTCCPGWTVSTLVEHLGKFHSVVAEWVTTGRRPDTWDSAPTGDLAEWAARCSARLLDAVGTVDPKHPPAPGIRTTRPWVSGCAAWRTRRRCTGSTCSSQSA